MVMIYSLTLASKVFFQLASMHPEYCFDGEDYDDSSNFTNRSPYPVIHIIREASMAKVLSVYNEPEKKFQRTILR